MTNENRATGVDRYRYKVGDNDLKFREFETDDPILVPDQILDAVDAKPAVEYIVYGFCSDGDLLALPPKAPIDLKESGVEHFLVFKTDRTFRYAVDDEPQDWGNRWISGRAVRRLGGISPEKTLFLADKNAPDREISVTDMIDLDDPHIERFYTRDSGWKLKIRQQTYSFPESIITVEQALEAAGFDLHKGWDVVFVTKDGRQSKDLDDKLDLGEPGIERLRVKPKNVNNGEATTSPRRLFQLLEKDLVFLGSLDLVWETLEDAGKRWLIVREYKMPEGYSSDSVDLAFEIPLKYPSTGIDMFYVFPILTLRGGGAIDKTDVKQLIEGRSYQRWSRHRYGETTWDPSFDCVDTHWQLVDECLLREVDR